MHASNEHNPLKSDETNNLISKWQRQAFPLGGCFLKMRTIAGNHCIGLFACKRSLFVQTSFRQSILGPSLCFTKAPGVVVDNSPESAIQRLVPISMCPTNILCLTLISKPPGCASKFLGSIKVTSGKESK